MSASNDLSNSNSIMPTKMATCCERKAVFVTVYVENPSRRASSNRHHRIHKNIKQELIGHKHGGGADKGYNRRTELLHYSRRLRESARLSASAAIQSKPVSSIDHRQPSHKSKVMAVQRKARDSRSGACSDIWRIMVPSLFRSLTKKNNDASRSSNNKIQAVMKSPSAMQKTWSFFSKPISMLHKKQNRQGRRRSL